MSAARYAVLDEYAISVVGKFGMVWGVAVSAYYWVLEDQPAPLCGVWTETSGPGSRNVLFVGSGSTVR